MSSKSHKQLTKKGSYFLRLWETAQELCQGGLFWIHDEIHKYKVQTAVLSHESHWDLSSGNKRMKVRSLLALQILLSTVVLS